MNNDIERNYGTSNNNYDKKYTNEYNNYNDEFMNNNWSQTVRIGFIRKVYGILSFQLLFTVIMCIISCTSRSFALFQINNVALLWLSIIGSIIVSLCIICVKSLARTTPTNYILLGLFTFFESYLVSAICSTSDPKIVLMAAAMTCTVVLALTIYACTTKTDFTLMGGMLFVLGCVLFLFGIFAMFSQNKIVHIIYSCLGVILFGFYLIYDTQLIVGQKSNELDIDDYILGAFMLYTDIISLFLHILSLLKEN